MTLPVFAHLTRIAVQTAMIVLLALPAPALSARTPERIKPFIITENGLPIETVNFGPVPPRSFHQRFLVIANASQYVLKKVAVKVSGNFKASNCMSEFLPGMVCYVILNYKAPAEPGWHTKWLTLDFNYRLQDNSRHSDSQRIQIIGGVQSNSDTTE